MRLQFRPHPLLFTLALTGCGGVLEPQGPVGGSEKLILLDSLAIMLVIVVPTIATIFAFAWWFRSSNHKARYRPDWAFSGALEVIVWAIPALVITFLGGIAWFGSQALDPYKPLPSQAKPIEVEVVSLDWKWLFIYPDEGVATVNQLVVPIGRPVHFQLTSSGIMNSFFVPQLGSQIYTMANMTSQLSLQADHAGSYRGMSAQFSGDGFAGMQFELRAVEPGAYTQWVSGAKSSALRLDAPAYFKLAAPSQNVVPFAYGGVAPTLFGDIAAGKLPLPNPVNIAGKRP